MTPPRVHTAGPVRWDTGAITADLRRRFPGVPLWWSERNGGWLAMLLRASGDQLIEAETPAELEQRLLVAGVRPVHPPQPPAGMPGTGGMTAGSPVRRPAPSRPPSARPAPRPVRGRHEVQRRRGWLRRLLDRLTYTDDWDW